MLVFRESRGLKDPIQPHYALPAINGVGASWPSTPREDVGWAHDSPVADKAGSKRHLVEPYWRSEGALRNGFGRKGTASCAERATRYDDASRKPAFTKPAR